MEARKESLFYAFPVRNIDLDASRRKFLGHGKKKKKRLSEKSEHFPHWLVKTVLCCYVLRVLLNLLDYLMENVQTLVSSAAEDTVCFKTQLVRPSI